MAKPRLVWYRPHKEDPRFKNVGHRPILPAVVVKEWDAVQDLQVLPTLDLNVLQDAQAPVTFVPFVKHGTNVGEWSEDA